MFDVTGTDYVCLGHLLNETLTIQGVAELLLCREKSYKGRLVARSINFPNRICCAGYKRYGVSARLFKKDEEGRGDAPNKMKSTVDSLDTSRDITECDLKLDTHNQFENGETCTRLSEKIQNNLLSVTKKDVSPVGKSLKNTDSYVSDSKNNKFNMIMTLNEIEREKILVDLISVKWDNKVKKFVNIHEVMFDTRILIFACADVLKAKGADTHGGDKTTLDVINLEKIEKLSQALLDGSWRPGVARRVLIPKKKPGEFCPLTVLSPMDKVVASAMKIVLNAIFEKHERLNMLPECRYFSSFSHGFRPNRGCHSAVDVFLTWGLTPWFIKADIEKCFDTIDPKRLLSILRESIEDQLMQDTLNKLFCMTIKDVEKGGPDPSKGIGVPQGNPLSSLLANIYLNEFDHFVGSLKKEIDKGKASKKTTKEWDSAVWVTVNETARAKTKKAKSNLRRELYRQKVKEATKAGIQKRPATDEQQGENVYHKLFYVRYADDYLIAVKGPKWLAKDVQKRTQNFLKSNLHFNLKEGNLFHAKVNKVEFLGFDIKVPGRNERAVVETQKILSFKKIRNRLTSRKNVMEARFEKAVLRAYEAQKLRLLKALMGDKKVKFTRNEVINLLAHKDAYELLDLIELKSAKWISGQQPFKSWVQKEFRQLHSSWIQKNELKELGYGEIIDVYNNLLSVMKNASSNKNLTEIKSEEVKRIIVNPNYKQMHVDRILYGQSQGLNPRLYAPIWKLKKRMVTWGMITNKGKPKASGTIFRYHEISIIDFYKQKALGFLNYYKPAVNFHEVRKLADYHMRWSLLHTLAGKYKKKVHHIIKRYGKTPKIVIENWEGKTKILTSFFTPNEINHRSRGFNKSYDPVIYKESLDIPISKLPIPKTLFSKQCAVKGCTNKDTEVYHIRALKRVKHAYFVESIKSKNKSLRGSSKIESALNRKQIPLCKEHHAQWPKLEKSQIDEFYLKEVVEPIISVSKEA